MTGAHRSVGYAGPAKLNAATQAFLSEGVAHEQTGFFGWGRAEELMDGVPQLAGTDSVRADAVRVTSLDQHFRRHASPDPSSWLTFWFEATRAALDAGFTALRAVADTTPWLAEPAQRAVLLQGEFLVDRYRLDHPFTLICAFDESRLDADAISEISCIHPVADGVSAPFHLHAARDADFALRGEIDAFSAPLLDRMLEVLAPRGTAGQIVIDASSLDFLDHRTVISLDRHAERFTAGMVVLRAARPVSHRLNQLLDLSRVRVEAAA